jgi:hypothetical protein
MRQPGSAVVQHITEVNHNSYIHGATSQRFCHTIGDVSEEPTHMLFEDSETSNAPKKQKRRLKHLVLSNVATS